MSPEKRKQKSDQHQQQELCVEQPDMAIRVTEFESLIEVFHAGTLGPLILVAEN
jgi:hypothetical protein